MNEEKPFYRVELADKNSGCSACGHGQMWTIVSGEGDHEEQVHTSWGDREFVDDLCGLMNDAYQSGQINAADNVEEEKLVAFFRSPEGDELGRSGDHDELSPAQTAIRAMRTVATVIADLKTWRAVERNFESRKLIDDAVRKLLGASK